MELSTWASVNEMAVSFRVLMFDESGLGDGNEAS